MKLYGKKVGMTQIFDSKGDVLSVTVCKLEENEVLDIKTRDRDGYDSLVLGTFKAKKKTAVNKPQQGLFTKAKSETYSKIYEMRLDSDSEYKVGDKLSVTSFADIKVVDVMGISKGKGFAGVIKRHHMGGGRASHGTSKAHRQVGSTGGMTGPGRCFPGIKNAGHMGAERVTIEKLEVVSILEEQGVILIKGSVPGANGSMVQIRQSLKSKQ